MTIQEEIKELALKILAEFQEMQCFDNEDKSFTLNDDETPLMSYSYLEKELGVPKPKLQVAVKALRDNGIVELVPAVDRDYIPNGSGWTLTGKGVGLINHLAEGKSIEDYFNNL